MEFFNWTFRLFRPLAARTDCVIEGRKYKAGEYIKRRDHKVRNLKRAYFYKQIGHPRESFGKPADFGIERTINKPVMDAPKAEVVHRAGPWYDVYLDGEKINEKSLNRDDAELLAGQ